MPGPTNTVYMDWTQETLSSPYYTGPSEPEDQVGTIYRQLNELQEDGYIEFYEMAESLDGSKRASGPHEHGRKRASPANLWTLGSRRG